MTAIKCTKSTKLIEFQFRFLHQPLATNVSLVKMGYKDDIRSTFCQEEGKSFTDLFWFCSKMELFWKHLIASLHLCRHCTLVLSHFIVGVAIYYFRELSLDRSSEKSRRRMHPCLCVRCSTVIPKKLLLANQSSSGASPFSRSYLRFAQTFQPLHSFSAILA